MGSGGKHLTMANKRKDRMARFLVLHMNLAKYGGTVCYNVIKTLVAHGQDVELLTLSFDRIRYRDIMGEESLQVLRSTPQVK